MSDAANPLKKFGLQVRRVRTELGLSTADLARHSAVEVGTIALLENGDELAIKQCGSAVVAVLSRLEFAAWTPRAHARSEPSATPPRPGSSDQPAPATAPATGAASPARSEPASDVGSRSSVARVRDVRREIGWSQSDLAHALGMHQPQVSLLENGKLADGEALARQAIALMQHSRATTAPTGSQPRRPAPHPRSDQPGQAVRSEHDAARADSALMGQLREFMSARMLSVSRIARECHLSYDTVESFLAGRAIGVEARDRLTRFVAGDALLPAREESITRTGTRERRQQPRSSGTAQHTDKGRPPAGQSRSGHAHVDDDDLALILLDGLKDLV